MLIKLPDIWCVALDVGETIGIAEYYLKELRTYQCNWEEFLDNYLNKDMFGLFKLCIIESYRVYSNKALTQTNSDMLTPQIIGTVKKFCKDNGIEFKEQSASIAKNLCTNELLKDYGFYVKGQKHSRDACRHLLYHLLIESNGRKK